MKLIIAAAAVALTTLSAGAGNSSPREPQTAAVTRDAGTGLSPCKNLPQLPTAQCGTITVPLDRTRPRLGSTTVAYAVVPRADQSQASLGTVATNPGGPGGSTIDNAGPLYAGALAPLLARRELLLMDTRGVGRSDPLDCPALKDPARFFSGRERLRTLIGQCGTQLGSRFSTYGSAVIADDLDDVRAAVGVDKLDLLGDSYGTFLMPTYAHRHPKHVRSVVLSGAYAVNEDPGVAGEKALRRAIRLVGARTGDYSGVKVIANLSALATRLRGAPTKLNVRWEGQTYRAPLNEWQLAGMVGAVYSATPQHATQLALADAAAASRTGDLRKVKAMVRTYLVGLADTYALGSTVVSDAANWATTCHDYPKQFELSDNLRTRRTDFNADVAAQNPDDFGIFSARAWITRANFDSGACLMWPNDLTARTPFAVNAKLPNVPVLVLSGDLDANTPSAAGRQAAAQFPNSTWMEIKGAGHTPTFSATGQRLAMAFIASPNRTLKRMR